MNLAELFATWRVWNERNVVEQAMRRAETDGRHDLTEQLRHTLDDEERPSAVEALAAQHELAELLGGWRWHTITAAREQGATWGDVAAATGTNPTTARAAYREQIAAAEHAAEAYGIAFDAERHHAAARDDTGNASRGPQEVATMSAEQPAPGLESARQTYIARRMHEDFVRPDFLDRLAEHAGVGEDDDLTSDHFAAFDEARALQYNREFDLTDGTAPDVLSEGSVDDSEPVVGDRRVEHFSGPDQFDDGLVVGEIALPGGLPPDEDDGDGDGPGVDRVLQRPAVLDRSPADVVAAAEANGEPPLEAMDRYRAEYTAAVRADPQLHAKWLRAELMAAYTTENGPPSYDREVMDDWVRQPITEPSRTAALEAQLAAVERDAALARADRAEEDGASDAVASTFVEPSASSGLPAWVETEEGQAHIREWASETADPEKALEAGPRDDPNELEQRLNELRVRLTGYTWREGVDRDEALADRREQLGRWYDDDQTEQHDLAREGDDGTPSAAQIECGPDDWTSS